MHHNLVDREVGVNVMSFLPPLVAELLPQLLGDIAVQLENTMKLAFTVECIAA